MKFILVPSTILLAAFTLLASRNCSAGGTNLTDTIELVRSTYRTDRQAFIAEAMHLTETESAGFWPLYKSYREDMDKLGDGLVKLVLEYSDQYPDLSDDGAERLLKQYMGLEKALVDKRAWYLKRAGRVLPAAKVLRWAQLENRLDLGLRLQLAGTIPLAPADQKKPE